MIEKNEETIENWRKQIDLQTVSMQTLAFVGDAVYDLHIRCYLAASSLEKTGILHRKATHFVSARSQARIVDSIFEYLTENEQAVYKRGRNTNIITSKHAEVIEYKKATGLEALIGYLYIEGNQERVNEIIRLAIQYGNEEEANDGRK